MAEVFRAKPMPVPENAGNKQLALKRILPHLAEDDEFITMFVDEAKLTVNLEHPNIVETYELGDFKDSYYILMEFISGADVLALQKRLRRQRKIMSVAQACHIAKCVAQGLEYAHQATDEQGRPFNLIHRDVSPQNIRITFDGRVKLIDFGIAKAASQRTKTQVGVLKGKFGYMSPEQVNQKDEEKDIDHRADLFALGTCLWEMLTNRRLFQGDDEYETFQMLKNPSDRPAPSDKNSQVPPEVDRIVGKALAEDRERRYQTGGEMADDLEAYLSSLDQPYTREHLSAWMADMFSEELQEERDKRSMYRELRSPTDVRIFIDEHFDEEEDQQEEVPSVSDEQIVESKEADAAEDDEADLWEPDFAPGEEDVDRDEFVSNHTRVAAGGFDPSEFDDDEEDPAADAVGEDVEAEREAIDDEFGGATLDDEESSGPQADQTPVPESRPKSPSPEAPSPATSGGSGGRTGGREPTAGGRQGVKETLSGPRETGANSTGESEETEGRSIGEMVRLASAVVAVAGVIALGVVTGLMGYQKASAIVGGSQQPATVVVSASPLPDEGATVRINGEKRGTGLPLAVADLKAGKHTISVEHPSFQTVSRTVELRAGEWEQLDLTLERDSAAKGVIRLTWGADVEDVDLYLDGELVQPTSTETSDGEVVTEVQTGSGRHLIEAVGEGVRPWSRVVKVASGSTITEPVTFESTNLSLGLEASGDATVHVDGENRGTVPVKIDDLSPLESHALRLEWSDESWETTLAFPDLGSGTKTIQQEDLPESLDEEDVARLEISAGEDWWPIFIDGAPTGLTTTSLGNGAIPVTPGEHQITFRRGGSTYETTVEVEAGEETTLDREVEFEWPP